MDENDQFEQLLRGEHVNNNRTILPSDIQNLPQGTVIRDVKTLNEWTDTRVSSTEFDGYYNKLEMITRDLHELQRKFDKIFKLEEDLKKNLKNNSYYLYVNEDRKMIERRKATFLEDCDALFPQVTVQVRTWNNENQFQTNEMREMLIEYSKALTCYENMTGIPWKDSYKLL
jgi:hypothetical protein